MSTEHTGTHRSTGNWQLFLGIRGVHSKSSLERKRSSGGDADDRLDVVHHAADGVGGGGRVYKHVCTQGGRSEGCHCQEGPRSKALEWVVFQELESEGREDRAAHLCRPFEQLVANSYPPGDFAASVACHSTCANCHSQKKDMGVCVMARHTCKEGLSPGVVTLIYSTCIPTLLFLLTTHSFP